MAADESLERRQPSQVINMGRCDVRHRPLSSLACRQRIRSSTNFSPFHPFLLHNFPHRDCRGRTWSHLLISRASSKIITSVIISSSTIQSSTSTRVFIQVLRRTREITITRAQPHHASRTCHLCSRRTCGDHQRLL